MFKKIVVPLDGSRLAEEAMYPALALAEMVQGEIVLLRVPVYHNVLAAAHSVGTTAVGADFGVDDEDQAKRRDQCLNYLRSLRQIHIDRNVTLTYKVVEGDAASAILDIAVAESVDLIVMTTHGIRGHGRSGFTRWMLGSVTERVLRHAHCPVLAIRSRALPSQILIALDGSSLAEHSLEPGLTMAKCFGSQATLLRVQVPFDQLTETLQTQVEEERQGWILGTTEAMRRAALRYLEDIKNRYLTQFPGLKIAVTTDDAAEGILHFAEQQHIDLIIMTTHGLTGMFRWDYGSVTWKVLRSADCALCVVPPPEFLRRTTPA